ncbi:GTPase HflX [Effusibacillus consociatus]|uniref:GTPase HflX n=1 Tax=Effusibacillus consociatus TaxID=1117041 RepID=A0ABV9PY06_9BACL
MPDTEISKERALLVGLHIGKQSSVVWQMAFDELAGLVETAGAEVVSTIKQSRDVPEPATYIGKGKLQELTALVRELEANLVVFDSELSPAQVRNLEQILPCKVLDRTQVILDIFAGRAQTKEGKLQVELAQLSYLLPRLTGKGIELSRLGGGIGTRGPGETKLEADRRRIRDRISDLKRELREVRRHREVQRQQRKKRDIPVIALVGYTNAGKSSLLRAIVERVGSGSKDVAEGKNRLFDTLDPTARRTMLPDGRTAIFTDTVGFIQQLPHQLVDAFRATLEETVESDLLLHVVDASHPAYDVQMQTVYDVLDELGVKNKPIITVFNKIDIVSNKLLADDPQANHTVRLSAKTGEGIPGLIRLISEWSNRSAVTMQVLMPYNEGPFVARLHAECKIYHQEFLEEGILLKLDAKPEFVDRLTRYKVT